MGNNCYLAVDIGASSGRHIVGSVNQGKIELTETYRFENGLTDLHGHKCWNIAGLRDSVIEGLRETIRKGYVPKAMGIDTWAVDFVLLDEKDEIIGDAVAYRDARTDGIKDSLEREGVLTFAETYARTGIQYQQFNTIYQLVALQREHPEYLERAKTFLMIPDYLNFVLTGVKVNEYTNASTTALVNAETKNWDDELIARLGLPREIFQEIRMPGTVLGNVKPELLQGIRCVPEEEKKKTSKFTLKKESDSEADETALNLDHGSSEHQKIEDDTDQRDATGLRSICDIKVILPATHDTGSAFLSVPARDDHAIFLSSGTWSLMGVENPAAITNAESREANFTNEGGYEYRFRYLKNIMGLWMIQNVRKELGRQNPEGVRPSFPQLIAEAEKFKDLKTRVDVDDSRFLAPSSMIREVEAACRDLGEPIPDETGAVMQVIYNSLSDDYARTAKTLSKLTGKTYTSINIVGGGSQDGYLNQRTADATGLTVFAGPTEGTALGNLMVQFIHEGVFADLQTARDTVRKSFDIKMFQPQQTRLES